MVMCNWFYSHAKKHVNMIIYVWETGKFVTWQGHFQPRFYSKARELSNQL